ncbi:MAG TPA: type IV pilin protein [Steroidobacteraceae bacterium]|nr:type IV pilin protein [Steroidobacteraceae bacterium]
MKLRAPKAVVGFTLIELMIVVVIATILLSIAIPSYMQQVRQSRRTEAKTAILDLAGREESFFSTNGSAYTAAAGSLGYTTFNPIGSGYYQITVCVPAAGNCTAGLGMPNPPAAPSYTIVATPLGTQVNDTQCTAFAVDSTGQQFATGTGGTALCWSQ